MKTKTKFIMLAALAAITVAAWAGDNYYMAGPGQSVDATTHAPAAIKATNDGTAYEAIEGLSSLTLTPTLVVTNNGTYNPNTSVGGLLTFTNIVREAGSTALLRDVTIIDSNTTAQKQPMVLVLFDSGTLTGNYTDHTSGSLNAADVPHIIATIPITAANYNQVGSTGCAVADIQLTQTLDLTGTFQSCAGLLLMGTSGTSVMTGTNTIAVKIGVTQN